MAKKRKSPDDPIKDENINESDDNFGLPEIEYEPLNREEEPVQEKTTYEETRTETTYTETTTSPVEENTTPPPTEDEDLEAQERESYRNYSNKTEANDSSNTGKVIFIIIIIIAFAGGAGWYFRYYQPKKKAEQERIRQQELAKQEADRLKDAARAAELKRQEDEQRRADSLANAHPSIGTIEQLEGRTGRYYVVVASAIDDDLILDYAKELSKKGVSSKVIPPFGKTKFSRIAVSEADNYADAQTIADGLKSEYGDGAWVVKY